MNNYERRKIGIIHINKDAIIQYILIYIMIQYIGGRVLTVLGSDLFYGGTLIFCIFLMYIFSNRIPLKKSVFVHLILLGFSMSITFIITSGDLSIGTILSIATRFILVYVAIQFNTDRFLDRFLKLVFIMSCVSLFEFAFVQILGETRALSLFSHLYETKNGAYWLGNSYGLFFICYNFMDSARNAYMFGEPGEYQILVITALYFMTFYDIDLHKKGKTRYYIIFLITLITTQSTTGYFNLIALAVVVLLMNRDKINPTIRKIILGGILILILYMFLGYSQDSFLYKNFFSKILSEEGTLDLASNTGLARVGPMKRFVETINSVPQKLIFGVGFDGLQSLPLDGYTTCGLINTIAMLGIFSSLILYGKMLVSIIRYSISWLQIGLGLFIVINMGLSQPDVLSVMSVQICMYGLYSEMKNRECVEDCDG